jgi:hypothetical protein
MGRKSAPSRPPPLHGGGASAPPNYTYGVQEETSATHAKPSPVLTGEGWEGAILAPSPRRVPPVFVDAD